MLPPPKDLPFLRFWVICAFADSIGRWILLKDLKMVEHLQQTHMARQEKYRKGEGV